MFDFIIKNKIRKISKNSKRTKRFLSLDKIHTFFVVFETDDYVSADAFIEKLERMGKRIYACCYKSHEDKYDYSETPFRVVIPKIDTDRSGVPRHHLIEELQQGHYEALIDLTVKENYTLEYIVASLDIPLKVGLKKNDLPIYDLAISKLPEVKPELDSETDELGRQILHYLNTIRSVD